DRDANVLRQAHGGFDVDAREHAVAADGGVDDVLAAVLLEFPGQVEHVVPGQLRPAVGGDLAVARIQADDDVAREGRAGVAEEARVLDRRRADDHVGDAVVQVVLDRVQVADAAADLHRDGFIDGVHDGLDGGAVAWLAGHGAVQVHQVQAASPLGDPLVGHGGGVFGKHGGLVQVALAQAHTLPVFEVDGGDEQHDRRGRCGKGAVPGAGRFQGCQRVKLRYIRSPGAALFSGWNCTAKILPSAMAQQNGRPWWLMPAVSAGSSGTA